MKPLEKDELYQNVQQFLKNRGVELKQGSYSTGIEKSCALLSDAINLGQQGVNRAKLEFDKKLDQLRQVIHEKTAPASSAKPGAATAANPKKRAPKAQRSSKSRKRAKPSKLG